MGTLDENLFTFTDGYVGIFAAYLPTSYVAGQPQKWVVGLHPGGGTGAGWAEDTGMQAAAEAYNLVIIAFDGTSLFSQHNMDWVDTDLTPNKHLEEGIAHAIIKYSLSDYLPGLIGNSMGGYKTLFEAVHFPEKYSAFAAGCPPAEMKIWDNDILLTTGSHNGQFSFQFGGYSTDIPLPIDVSARYTYHSPTLYFPFANLKGRKIWIGAGTDDTVVNYTKIYLPLLSSIPSASLYAHHEVPATGHTSITLFYTDEIMSFMANSATLATKSTIKQNVKLKMDGTWNSYAAGYVKDGGKWNPIDKIYNKNSGVWSRQ